ncbi:MAG: efflux RND transporter periplasmic adaptor subunit [Planctomycetales bacterium]|nr:efflux RND transporter periplasmic adaptor subunit [Planctomycetales bacterium]
MKPQESSASLGDRVRSLRLPEDVKNGHRKKTAWLPWTLCVVLTLVTGWLLYDRMQGPPRSTASSSSPNLADDSRTSGIPPANTTDSAGSQRSTPVGSGDASAKHLSDSDIALESKGYIIPRRKILVSPQVNGRLIQLNIEEGQRVSEGDVLAKVDPTEYASTVAAAEASLARAEQELLELQRGSRPQEIKQAEAELREAEAQQPQLEAEYERIRQLSRQGASSKLEYDQAESAYRMSLRRIERLKFALDMIREGPRPERIKAAEAAVDQAKAELARAQWQLDNCTIKAPISGTVLEKNAEEGNLVNPVAFNGSFSICQLADLSDLEVELNIQERDVAKVFVGQRCEVQSDAFPQRRYAGGVSRLMPIADRAKGAVPVRVKVTVPADEEGVYLKPEMSALVTFFGSP